MRRILTSAEFTATVGPRENALTCGHFIAPHVYLLDVKDVHGKHVADFRWMSRRAGVWDTLKSGDVIAFNADRDSLSRPRNIRLVTARDETDLRGPSERAARVQSLV